MVPSADHATSETVEETGEPQDSVPSAPHVDVPGPSEPVRLGPNVETVEETGETQASVPPAPHAHAHAHAPGPSEPVRLGPNVETVEETGETQASVPPAPHADAPGPSEPVRLGPNFAAPSAARGSDRRSKTPAIDIDASRPVQKGASDKRASVPKRKRNFVDLCVQEESVKRPRTDTGSCAFDNMVSTIHVCNAT